MCNCSPKNAILSALGFIFFIILGLYLIKAFDISYPLTITSTTKSTELAVVGEGKIDVVPDLATISVGITVNNASTVSDAEKTINDTNNKIIAAMEKLGIKKTDIKTSNYSINPSYSSSGEAISGYNGNATVEIKVRNTSLASQVVSEATKAGANQIFSTEFTVENPAKYREQARNAAIENAKQQANNLASSLGIRLGKVTNIVESSPSSPVFLNSMAKGLGGASAPQMEQGSQTITSTVTLYFEKK